jgi:biotin-dependent carboxylase-like uncharacterized protein
MLTTVQDRGRFGCAMLGVGRAGAMDDVSMRLANALVGNAADAAVLEITLAGPRLRFDSAATIALTGADFPLRIDDADVAMWQTLDIAAGSVLAIGAARRGTRAGLAIAGGFAAEALLGSVATDVNAQLGGIDGRPLREGDRLGVDESNAIVPRAERSIHAPRWSLDPRPWFDAAGEQPIGLLRGTHFDALDTASRKALFAAEFRIGKDSNRVGFRLAGPHLALAAPIEMVSEPLAFGTLQLPPGGEPIALMAEHPTIGGYPRVGQIAAADFARLAQRRPGDSIRFTQIDLDGAQTRYLERERELQRMIDAIGERLTA